MAIQFSCACGQVFRVDDKHAGRKTKCRVCGTSVSIPTPKAKPSKPPKEDDEDLFVLEPADETDDDDQFDFALEETQPKRRLTGKAGAKKKRRPEPSDEETARPVKKKKKQKQAAEPQGLSPAMIGVFAVLGLVGLSAIGFGLMKVFSGGAVAAAPAPVQKQLVTLKHEIGSFQIDYPNDWSAKSAGGAGGIPPSAQIEGEDAYFNVKGSIGGAAISDMAKAGANATLNIGLPGDDEGGDGGEEEMDLEPVAAVHGYHLNRYELEYNNYEETPPETVDSKGFGEGRVSTFTASSGLFGGKIKGFRGTFLANDYQYNVFCYVPERQFPAYEQTFRSMIQSFRR